MEHTRKDPLLMSAKVLTIIVRIGLVIGMIALGVGMAGIAAVGTGWVPDNVQIEFGIGENSDAVGAAVLAMFGGLIALGLSYDFVAKLAQVIDTVGDGDPFTIENAARLTRMAWLALAVQIVSFAAGLLGTWAEEQFDQGDLSIDMDMSLTGIALAITLFILARVFREGARMRDELEGTV